MPERRTCLFWTFLTDILKYQSGFEKGFIMVSIVEKIKNFFASAPAEICKPGYNALEKIVSGITFVFDCIYRVLLEFAKLVILVIVIIVSCQVF